MHILLLCMPIRLSFFRVDDTVKAMMFMEATSVNRGTPVSDRVTSYAIAAAVVDLNVCFKPLE